MRVILAEKPSVARDLAHALGCTHKEQGFFRGKSDLVTWAIGHLVRFAEPGPDEPRMGQALAPRSPPHAAKVLALHPPSPAQKTSSASSSASSTTPASPPSSTPQTPGAKAKPSSAASTPLPARRSQSSASGPRPSLRMPSPRPSAASAPLQSLTPSAPPRWPAPSLTGSSA